MQYHKNAETFEAKQFTGGAENAKEILSWLSSHEISGVWVPNVHAEELGEYLDVRRRNIPVDAWIVVPEDCNDFHLLTTEEFKAKYTPVPSKNTPRVRLHKAVEKDLGIELLWGDLDDVKPPLSRELRDRIFASRFNAMYGKQSDVLSEAFGMFMKPQKKTEAPTLAELLENPAMKGLFNHFYGKQETEEGSDSDTNESAEEEKLEPKQYYTNVDAMQFNGGKKDAQAICYWIGKNGGTAVWTERQIYQNTDTIAISSGGATYHVRPGMWIIRQSDGTFAACINEVFQKNYQPHAEKDAEPLEFDLNEFSYLADPSEQIPAGLFSPNWLREALGLQKLPVVNISITNHGTVEETDAVSAYPEAGPADEGYVGIEKELERLINRYSGESVSGTPDFILAKFLIETLKSYNEAVSRRAEWRGEEVRFVPGSKARRENAVRAAMGKDGWAGVNIDRCIQILKDAGAL